MKTNWQTKNLGEVLEYEQPALYIVSSKNYKEEYETPVLTAGKSFILGKTKEKNGIFPKDKLPVIIFDDFTTATKFVDFPFKVKSSAMKILHPVKNISDAKFLFYLIQNISFDYTGIHKRYWISEYSNIEILLPPLSEQHRIVKILDEVFLDVAKAKENTEKNLQNAKDLFESYLQSIFANPGKDWEGKSLEDLGKITSSKRIYKNEYVKEGVPFYRIKEIKELAHDKNITLELYISKKRYKEIKDIFGVPLIGDVLMTAVGTIGEIYIVKNDEEFYFKDGNILWFKNFNSVDPYFLKFILMSFVEQINKLSQGSAYNALTIEKIEKHRIFLPKSLTEQKSIVKKINQLSVETKKLENIYKKKLANLEELKKSFLKKAFSGEL